MALWFEEIASPNHRLGWKVRRVLADEVSPYQRIQVVETEQFGHALVLDGILQTTEGDEFIYHEMLAHVALTTHPSPRRVLIVGGGDGGTAREVLRAPATEEVVLAEIDRRVVEMSRTYLPGHTVGLDDPRLRLEITDGAKFVEAQSAAFDVILVDATDPDGSGPGRALYTEAFHRALRKALRPGGLYVQHAGAPFYNPEVLRGVSESAAQVFPLVRVFTAPIPTYPGAYFSFVIGSLGPDPVAPAASFVPEGALWYTPAMHRAAFVLPPYVLRLLPLSVQIRAEDSGLTRSVLPGGLPA